MFSIRNIGGVALFLFGTTFLWLTPSFATKGVSTKSGWWSVTNALALVTVVVFTAATWGLFNRAEWWELVAISGAILGAIVLVPYWIAANNVGDPGRGMNLFVHVLGDAGVLVLLNVPTVTRWVESHVMAGK